MPVSRRTQFVDLDDLNAQAKDWCLMLTATGSGGRRHCIEDLRLVVLSSIGRLIHDNQADEQERQADVKTVARRSAKVIYAFLLSWHPDEAAIRAQ